MDKNRATTIGFEAHAAGLTWTSYVSKDGGAYVSTVGTVSAVSSVTNKSYELSATAEDTNADTLDFLIIANDGIRYSTGSIETEGSGVPAGSGTRDLEWIRQQSMDRVDEQTNPAAGKYSVAWWTRQINQAQTVLANHVGYYMVWTPASVKANVASVPIPADMVWGLTSVKYQDSPLNPEHIVDRDTNSVSFRNQLGDTPGTYTIVPPNVELNPAPARTVVAGGTLLSATAGGGFTNQPTNDGIEIVSSNAGDTTQTIDVYGVSFQAGEVVKETVTLTGTTAVSAIKTDWGDMLGFELSAVCAGTLTIRKVSNNATIATITAGNTTAGIAVPTSTDGGNAHPQAASSGTSTAVIGFVGTDKDGRDLTDNSCSLHGTSNVAQSAPIAMDTVTKILLGAVPASQNVTVTRGAALMMLCGMLPSDLSSDTDAPVGLHSAFVYVLAAGAAAMAQGIDLYAGPQEGRLNINAQAFWDGADKYRVFLDSLQGDIGGQLRVNNPYWSK